MALQFKRYEIEGYGQIELNNVAFPRDGRIEAQCKLDATDFADMVAENGMLLAVDNVTRTIKLPVDNSLPIALNYTTEHIYDERTPGLKNFRLTTKDFLPRLGYLSIGDKFTTNTICYDDNEFADDDAVDTALDAIATTPIYGYACADGAIKITATQDTDATLELKVIKNYTMPDGQKGLKFQVMKA
jgi:hypothetical protein